MQNIINWIENWFKEHCDGDWEHSNGIVIESSDNPGWIVKIDLTNTPIETLSVPYELQELDEGNWYGISVKDSVYNAVGDPSKLEFLLNRFKELIESGK